MPIIFIVVGVILGIGGGWFLWGREKKKPGLQSRGASSTGDGYYPFRRSDQAISDQELKLLKQLQWAMGDDTFIFAKVCLYDIVEVPKGTERKEFYANLARSRRVDFLLCDVKEVRPILAILTDKEPEEVTVQILEASRVPMLKLPAGEVYVPSELKNKIHFAIRTALDAVHGVDSGPEVVEER